MKYILETLNLMDMLCNDLGFEVDAQNRYRDIIGNIVALSKHESLKLQATIRLTIIHFITSLEVEKESILVNRAISPNVETDKYTIFDLSDIQLLRYLSMILRTVMWTQRDNLLLVKYSKNIWNTGWHNLAKECRGKVIDLDTKEIVVYPFDKFFNLNEVEETKEDRLNALIERANEIYVTEKKDGSAIIVTKYKGKVLLNTNGEFSNIQIKLATDLFNTKYKYFFKNVPDGYTFVFELIHPSNKIVIDYGDIRKLYLLAVRDLNTCKLKSYPELCEIAKKYKLDITNSFVFTSLYDFVSKTRDEEMQNREGWVFRLVGDDFDVMFKLKFEEYFRLARIQNSPSLKKLYALLSNNMIDDLIANSEGDLRKEIEGHISDLMGYFDKFKAYIKEIFDLKSEEYGVARGVLSKEQSMKLITDLRDNPFCSFIMRYARGIDADELFVKFPKVSEFESLYLFINERDGVSSEEWTSIS